MHCLVETIYTYVHIITLPDGHPGLQLQIKQLYTITVAVQIYNTYLKYLLQDGV